MLLVRGMATIGRTSLRSNNCRRLHDTTPRTKVLTLSSINRNLRELRYEVRGKVATRAKEIKKELEKGTGKAKPFNKVVEVNIGNPHALNQPPLTFARQVLALCVDPELLECKGLHYPEDVKRRAREMLQHLNGSGIGAYSESTGILAFRKNIEQFISERDGFPADYHRIFLTNGASEGIRTFLNLCIPGSSKLHSLDDDGPQQMVGFMTPVPQYPLYSACSTELGAQEIPYYLDEDHDWQLDMKDLVESVAKARRSCDPRVLVVINPGNPTGQNLSLANMEAIINFCLEQRLILLADEVYQENIYTESGKFISFKKVLKSMGKKYEDIELISVHSTSKGYFGECGLRGGYMELVGFEQDVIKVLERYLSSKLCSNLPGQIVTDIMINPPRPGDDSFNLYDEERSRILQSLKDKASLIARRLNDIEGIHCNTIQGAMYAFPRIELPPAAIEAARKETLNPDTYYCLKLLEETGISFVPGSGFGQVEGTFHFRTTILADENTTEELLDGLETFHRKFLSEHS